MRRSLPGRRSGWLSQRLLRARALRRNAHVVLLALTDPRTPWYAKLAAACVVAYALSPIDLIPDFIPVLGWLDDLILIPLGFLLVRRLIPPSVLADCQARADRQKTRLTRMGWVAAAMILAFWIAMIVSITIRIHRHS